MFSREELLFWQRNQSKLLIIFFFWKKLNRQKLSFVGPISKNRFIKKQKKLENLETEDSKITFLSGFAQNLKRQQEIFFEQNRGEEGLSHKALITNLHRLAIRKQKLKKTIFNLRMACPLKS